ncbi:MAG: 4-(cytidine 5'-diphospho)-2-C-methyl-D-erythritol kinase [Nitriliruptorales bacterium]|nr:4-(cytidine 5'-diphospho)-2-C-methyl-D-erythritol kinase [Nitriliruptorales bacterium]
MRHLDLDGPGVRVRVPAKLNLFLAIRGRRPDGYHELVTVFQTLSLFDEVRARLSGPPGRGHHPAARRRMSVELRTNGAPGLPEPADNLAVHAALALGRRTGLTALDGPPDAEAPRTVLELHKGIPVAGGMAGGSADAAATLVALNALWRCDLGRDDLRALAAELGSDVSFCVVGGTALATGRGTALAQVLCRGSFSWVVCTAKEFLATTQVYQAWDHHCERSEIEPDAVLQALRSQDAVALGAALHNDLEPAAFKLRPELRASKEALIEAGALGVVLSGSGPTLLALCEDDAAAQDLARRVRRDFGQTIVAQSPAGGPDRLLR